MQDNITTIFVVVIVALFVAYKIWQMSDKRVLTLEQYETLRNFARDVVAFVYQVYGRPSPDGELSGEELKAKAIQRLLEMLPEYTWGIPKQQIAAVADTIIEAAVLWLKQELKA